LSDDGSILTLHIRQGVTFYNGNPVDAKAFKHSFDRHISLRGGHPKAAMDMALGAIPEGCYTHQVEVVDTYTIRLHLMRPDPLTLTLLATPLLPIIDPALTLAHATPEDPWAREYWKTATMGTGPYRPGNAQPGVQWELEPYEGYWNKQAIRNEGIVFKVVPSAETRLQLLKRGQVDIVAGIPFRDLAELARDPSFKVVDFPPRAQNFMVINHGICPLNDVKVRRAILYALPYRDLLGVNCGFARPLRGPLTAGMPTADHSLWPYGEGANFAEANRLLRQAGLPQGFDIELVVHEGKQADLDSAHVIQAALEEVGIRTQLSVLPSSLFFDRLARRNAPLIIHYWYPFVYDPFYFAYYQLRADADANFWNYKNARIDALIRLGIFERDVAARERMSKEIQRIFMNDAVYANLFSQDLVFAMSRQIKGLIAHNDGQPRFWAAYKDSA
jgi:peptide/nickel transport system substrate-binding protein